QRALGRGRRGRRPRVHRGGRGQAQGRLHLRRGEHGPVEEHGHLVGRGEGGGRGGRRGGGCRRGGGRGGGCLLAAAARACNQGERHQQGRKHDDPSHVPNLPPQVGQEGDLRVLGEPRPLCVVRVVDGQHHRFGGEALHLLGR